MNHATINITFEEIFLISTALSYTYDNLKGIVPHADKYEKLRLTLHKRFAEHEQDD